MISGVRLVVLGKQGAGKGTQCVRLSHHYVVPHVSTGDMLRSEVKSRSPMGVRAAKLMEQGELIPDDLVMELVGLRLSERDTRGRGFVLDGCPRTTGQAEQLEQVVNPFGLDMVVDLQVPTPLVMKRLASRRVCVDCGANYSTAAPPLVNWTCDVCGGEVVQREDDTEEAIERRLNLYRRRRRRCSTGTKSATSSSRSTAPARPTPSPAASSARSTSCGTASSGRVTSDEA